MEILPALVLLLAIWPGISEKSEQELCNSPVTSDIEACLTLELERADSSLSEYLKEARKTCAEDAEDMAALEAAQKAWAQYVEADCKAAHQHWIQGTIRGAAYLSCKVIHTKSRTCDLWGTYLQNMATELPFPATCK